MSKKKELGGQMIKDFKHIDPNTIKNRSMILLVANLNVWSDYQNDCHYCSMGKNDKSGSLKIP